MKEKFKILVFLIILGSQAVYGQAQKITGTVTDENGQTLPGATVILVGTTQGTITDANGKYTLNATPGTQLKFTFVGYKDQIRTVGTELVISVQMTMDAKALEEVVIVGYGTQKKESVVAAITQATGEQIMTNLRGADMTNALTGSLPGLVTIQGTGVPGGSTTDNPGTEIYIRGMKTWNNSQPLILVDGIEREMNDVDPYSVENVSVLKDASATAVFGVKGANGVILITTKRGQVGKPQMSLNITTTGKTISRLNNRVGSFEEFTYRNYSVINQLPIAPDSWSYMTPETVLGYYRDQTYPDYLPDVNWQEETLKDITFDKTVNLSISGGTKFVKYFGSLSYLNEGDVFNLPDVGQGYTPGFGYDRLNFRSNLDFNITPSTTFSVSLGGFSSSQNRPQDGFWNNPWTAIYGYPPYIAPVRYSDGVWSDGTPIDVIYKNHIYAASMSGLRINKETQVFTDFQLQQKLDFITKGLALKGKLSYDIKATTTGPEINDDGDVAKWINPDIMDFIEPGMTQEQMKAIEAAYTIWNFPSSSTNGFDYVNSPFTYGSESGNDNIYRSLNYELSLNYDRTFGKHTVGGLFLMSRNEKATGSIFPSYREDWVGRAVYNYDGRYLLEFNGAYNGSEKFARKNRFGFFPSLAMGWVISNERFYAPLTPVVNKMKIRFSNGAVGSDAGIDRWLYTSSWNVTTNKHQFGSPSMITSVYPQRLEGTIPNPDIQWEVSEKTDLGLEMDFFESLIGINLDLFWEDRTNIFVEGDDRKDIPVYFGADPVAGNIGQVKNNGWEIELDFRKTLAGGLRLEAGLAWAYANDLVIRRSDPVLTPDYQKASGYAIGQPRETLRTDIMSSWNDVYVGVLGSTRTYELPGNFRAVDFNSDGIIDQNDSAPYGYPERPQYTYIPRVSAEYKGLSLSLGFYGTYNLRGESLGAYSAGLMPQFVEAAWNPILGITENAKFAGDRYQQQGGSGQLVYYSRSAFRLKTAVLAYNIKSKMISKMGISTMRIMLNGENLILWSDMLTDADRNTSFNTRIYPMQKRYTLGLNLNF